MGTIIFSWVVCRRAAFSRSAGAPRFHKAAAAASCQPIHSQTAGAETAMVRESGTDRNRSIASEGGRQTGRGGWSAHNSPVLQRSGKYDQSSDKSWATKQIYISFLTCRLNITPRGTLYCLTRSTAVLELGSVRGHTARLFSVNPCQHSSTRSSCGAAGRTTTNHTRRQKSSKPWCPCCVLVHQHARAQQPSCTYS